jgi:TRAP-type uncharacterized transport system fused permease subunit
MTVAFHALRLGILGFLIPYVMIYENGILMMGPWDIILLTTVTCVLGIYALGISFQGYLWGHVNMVNRVILAVIAIGFIIPANLFISIGLFAALVAVLFLIKKCSTSF